MTKDEYQRSIASISKEIQREISAEKIPCDIPTMDEPDKTDWQFRICASGALNGTDVSSIRALDGVQALKDSEVHYYRPMTSHYKWLRAIVIFAKRVIRKLVRFIGEPMVAEINQNRVYTVVTLESMQAEIVDLDLRMKELGELKQQCHELQKQMAELKRENEKLRKKLLGDSRIKI